jgi:cation diffusion facilitator family transporter
LHDVLKHGTHGHGGEHGHGRHDDHGHDHGDGHDPHDGHDHDAPKASHREHAKHRAKHAGHSLNLRGAWLHLAGDTLGSLAALGAAIVIHFGGPARIDPVASFLVASILVFGALRLIRDATLVLLEAAPVHLPVNAVREVILSVPEVVSIHDLHVWTLGAGHDAITARVHAKSQDKALATRVSRRLRDDFHVEYVTVQVDFDEDGDAPPSAMAHAAHAG